MLGSGARILVSDGVGLDSGLEQGSLKSWLGCMGHIPL